MQQRVTPKSLIAENKRRDYGRVRNHLKVILSNQSVGPASAQVCRRVENFPQVDDLRFINP